MKEDGELWLKIFDQWTTYYQSSPASLIDDSSQSISKGYQNADDAQINKMLDLAYDDMNDDFNTPILIATLFDAVKHINLINDGKESITASDKDRLTNYINAFVFDIMGLVANSEIDGNSDKLDGVVNLLIQLRNDARSNKDFATSDKIRDQLLAMGIQLKDGKDSTTFSVS